ncbi:hypothetical protein BT96DRAFT_299202 [Gymnopus androsaceus JB14]|uniref:DUF6534 domain-containing protein n=1 Tax=Gymnopus androsaceus JB14 TaxID=1447944 RepID=A0A6A4H236_9AGAR|nr:hypothetical protein BT96DRAFT_299202 [Gymnopus androsaceus JB14]
MQGHLYYQNCKSDSKWLISFVTLILLLEFGHAAATAQSVWWATITIADMTIKPGNGYAIAMCTLYSAVTTALVKVYYINRVRQLSTKTWPAVIGWLLAAIDAGLALAVSYEAFLDVPREPNNFNLEREWGWLISASLSTGAAMDFLIAAAMVYYLRRFSGMTMKHSADLLNRLLIWTIETGLLTSVASIAALICFHTMEFNYIWFAVYLPLAKLYSNAVLASLNARPARRQRLGMVQHSTESSPIRFASRRSLTNSSVSNSSDDPEFKEE